MMAGMQFLVCRISQQRAGDISHISRVKIIHEITHKHYFVANLSMYFFHRHNIENFTSKNKGWHHGRKIIKWSYSVILRIDSDFGEREKQIVVT